MYSGAQLATAVPILTIIISDKNNNSNVAKMFFLSTNKPFFTFAKFLMGAFSGCYFGDIGLNNYD